MAKIFLRLYADRLKPGAVSIPLAQLERAIYVLEGGAICRGSGVTAALGANSAWQGRVGVTLTAGLNGARLLRWELSGNEPALLAGEGVTSEHVLAGEPRIEPGVDYLMRCDRVDFPAGGIAFTHTHQGSGIRCLQSGRIRIQTLGRDFWIDPGGAWFESGPDPVFAQTDPGGPSHFVRVLILPRSIRGKSSIRYIRPEDADKPKTQTYQIFADDPIEL